MTKRGKNSYRHNTRKEAARIISQHALNDRDIDESVNMLHPWELEYHLQKCIGYSKSKDEEVIKIADSFLYSEVISTPDNRGDGTLQQLGAVI